MGNAMPYWWKHCVFCSGLIADALMECVPAKNQSEPAYQLLNKKEGDPGAAFPCPYCSVLLGFDDDHQIQKAQSGWRVFRYGLAELEARKILDLEPVTVSLAEWALKHRLMEPGSHQPLTGYIYAEQAPANEVVP